MNATGANKNRASDSPGRRKRGFSDGGKSLFIIVVLLLFPYTCGGGSGGSGQSAIPLPVTGQSASYAPNDDGALQKGTVWPAPRFADNNNATITDNLTGLVWLKQVDCFGTMNWNTALATANALSNGTCGLADGSRPGAWRVPNINELSSLVSIAAMNPAVPDNPFPAIPGGSSLSTYFWSSTTFAGVTYTAWIAHLDMGNVDVAGKKSPFHLLPVRDGDGTTGTVRLPRTGQTASYGARDDGALRKGAAWPSPRFRNNGDGTVTDNMTGLVWLKNGNCLDETVNGAHMMKNLGLMMWRDALTWTNALASGSCGLTDGSKIGDWRIPNRNELLSLIDRSRADLALPLGHPFDNVQLDGYWTSSSLFPVAGQPEGWLAWFAYPADGVVNVSDSYRSYTNYVWPVRDGSR